MIKRKDVVEFAIVILLIICGIVILNCLTRPTDTDGAYIQTEAFHSLPENTVDVIIYGSSHAMCGVNTMSLYEKYGIGAYNYSYYWQSIDTTKLFLLDSIQTQTPQIAVIETLFLNRTHEDCDLDPQIFYVRYLNCKKDIKHYLKKCFGNNVEKWLTYYMPLWMFHDNWANLTSDSFCFPKDFDSSLISMGAKCLPGNNPIVLSKQNHEEQEELDESAINELDEIVEICRKNNIEIIFFTAPCEGQYVFSDAITQYAADNDCVYINFFDHIDEVGINSQLDFYDAGHLNTDGATKIASYIGEFIKNNYNLKDMRKVEGNVWQQNVKAFHDSIER